jgi:hypothetical protein
LIGVNIALRDKEQSERDSEETALAKVLEGNNPSGRSFEVASYINNISNLFTLYLAEIIGKHSESRKKNQKIVSVYIDV